MHTPTARTHHAVTFAQSRNAAVQERIDETPKKYIRNTFETTWEYDVGETAKLQPPRREDRREDHHS